MKLSSWFKEEENMKDEMHIPGVAMVRLDDPRELHNTIAEAVGESTEDKRLKVIADAHVYVAQLGQEREGYRHTIEQLEGEKADLEVRLKAEIRRAELAELELSQALNDIKTKEADFAEKQRCLELLWEVLVKFNTKLPPKKERKNGKKSTDPVAPSVDPSPSPGVPDKAEG